MKKFQKKYRNFINTYDICMVKIRKRHCQGWQCFLYVMPAGVFLKISYPVGIFSESMKEGVAGWQNLLPNSKDSVMNT